MIKLYVLTAMLEVFDRLLGSFGQDAFEALHAQTQSPAFHPENVVTYVVLSLYVATHSFIYFTYVATLLVAVNSAEQALITVLFLNNFAEIKSFVFKKFDRISLFQLSCGDITERFQLVLFLLLIMVVSVAQAGSNWLDALYTQVFIFFVMLGGESVADWIKHAFIAKFNSLPSSMYEDMLRVLRKDIIGLFRAAAVDDAEDVLDHNYSITRRVGLSQIPLACVSIRYLFLAMDSPLVKIYIDGLTSATYFSHIGIIFLSLLALKVSIGVCLIRLSGWLHNQDLRAKEAATTAGAVASSASREQEREHREAMRQLAHIERYTLYKGRVHG